MRKIWEVKKQQEKNQVEEQWRILQQSTPAAPPANLNRKLLSLA